MKRTIIEFGFISLGFLVAFLFVTFIIPFANVMYPEKRGMECMPDVAIVVYGLHPPEPDSLYSPFYYTSWISSSFYDFMCYLHLEILSNLFEICHGKKILFTSFRYDSIHDIETVIKEFDNYTKSFKDQKISIIGLSMGGIIAVEWFYNLSNVNVCKIVTIASPHNGSSILKYVRFYLDEDEFSAVYGKLALFLVNKTNIIKHQKLFTQNNTIFFSIVLTNNFVPFDGILFESDQMITNKNFKNQLLFYGTFHPLSPFFDGRIIKRALLEIIE